VTENNVHGFSVISGKPLGSATRELDRSYDNGLT
jgi:hypothetical protein